MQRTVPHHLIELLTDCLLKSFWRKSSLKTFLRRSGVKEQVLSTLDHQETKRQWLDRLVPALERTDQGCRALWKMAGELADQVSFPDLEGWEDSTQKLATARLAVQRLKLFLLQQKQNEQVHQQVAANRADSQEKQAAYTRATEDLNELRSRFEKLASKLGTQKGGYEFQDWFYDLMDFEDIDHRRPYTTDGRQIDGSISIDGTTYLVELKFTSNQSQVTDIDSLRAKVEHKADNTMAILVSVSGYSSVAVDGASFARSPLLLLDHGHLYLALRGETTFIEVVRRVRRHSSQEGKAYLPVERFGG